MRMLFWFVILSILAISLAVFVQENQSNIVLFYPPYRVELSLNFFLLLWLGSMLLFYISMRTIVTLIHLPARAVKHRRQQQLQRASQALCEALVYLTAGRFARSEKCAEKAQMWPAYKEVAALLGARAAQGLNEIQRRDHWLTQINTPELQPGKWVAMAEMQLESRDPESALNTIEKLQAQGGKQIHVHKLALRVYQQLKNYKEMLRLLRLLEKRHALHPVLLSSLKQQACEALMKEQRHHVEGLHTFWRSLSSTERTLPYNADLAARLFISCGHYDKARILLEQALNTNWEPSLLVTYADCVASGVSALPMISQVEKWLRVYPREVALHYALGRLCWHQRLWGKAQSSLETVLAFSDDKKVLVCLAHITLAQLHEELEVKDLAYQHYRAAALLEVGNKNSVCFAVQRLRS